MLRTSATALLVAAGLVATGCSLDATGPEAEGTATGSTEAPVTADPTGASDDVRPADPDDAPLVLGVSNQSFDDPEVGLTVTVDEVEVVDGSFAVEGQHTVTFYGLDLAPGTHQVRVTSDTGASTSAAFVLPADERRWIAVNYWYLDPDKEGVTWGGDEQPGPMIEVHVSDERILIS